MSDKEKNASIYEFIFTTYAILILFIIIILCFNNFYNLLIFLEDSDENIIKDAFLNDKIIIKDLFGFKIVNYYINKAEYNKYPNTFCNLSLDINETILQFFKVISIIIVIIIALLLIIQYISRSVNKDETNFERFNLWNIYRSFSVLVIISIILLFVIIIYRISNSEVDKLMKNIGKLYIFNDEDNDNLYLHNKIRRDFYNLDETNRNYVKLSLETVSKYNNIDKLEKDNSFLNNLYNLCNKINYRNIEKSDIDVFKTFSKIINNYENTDNEETKKYDFFKDILSIDFNNQKYKNKDDIIILSSLLQAKYLNETNNNDDETDNKDDYITILNNEIGNEKTDDEIKLINIMKSSKRIVFNDIILIFIITFILIFCFIILSLTLYYSKKENINCYFKDSDSSTIWILDKIKPIYTKLCHIVDRIFTNIKLIL